MVLVKGNLNKPNEIITALQKMREQYKREAEKKRLHDLIQKGKITSTRENVGKYSRDLLSWYGTQQVWFYEKQMSWLGGVEIVVDGIENNNESQICEAREQPLVDALHMNQVA